MAGHGLFFGGLMYGLGAISLFLFRVIFVWLPSLLAVYIFTFALIAKLICNHTPQRIRAYRILMGFSFSGQIILLLVCIASITAGGWTSIIGLAAGIGVFLVLFFGMQGTYTRTLTEGGKNKG